MTRSIHILYFAQLREQSGRPEQTLETDAATPRSLFDELREQHGFSLLPDHLKVAVNDRMVDWDTPLNDGDTVLFVPPVAGG